VSSAARVSLGYLSEVERGQKEASSELLAAICTALGVRMSEVLREVSEELAVTEGAVLDSTPENVRAVLETVGAEGVGEPPVRNVVAAA
jgi:transcriptional regulator with XRE-family HTH domain